MDKGYARFGDEAVGTVFTHPRRVINRNCRIERCPHLWVRILRGERQHGDEPAMRVEIVRQGHRKEFSATKNEAVKGHQNVRPNTMLREDLLFGAMVFKRTESIF